MPNRTVAATTSPGQTSRKTTINPGVRRSPCTGSDGRTLDKEHQTYHELGRCPIAAAFSSPLPRDPVAVAASQRSLARNLQSAISR